MSSTITNNLGIPELLYKAIVNDDYVMRGNISTTSLIDSPRVRLLKRHNHYEIDASEMLFALLGKGVHSVLEKAAEITDGSLVVSENTEAQEFIKSVKENANRYLMEKQMSIQVNGWEVTGTADLYDKSEFRLDDYKTTSVWKAKRGIEHSPEWIKQTNIYAYMLRQLGYKVDSIRIIAIMKDWKKEKSRFQADYPKSAVMVLDVPVYKDEKILEFITARVKFHQEQEKIFCLTNEDGSFAERSIEYCTKKERWGSDDVWKIVERGKSRSSKNVEITCEADKQVVVDYIREHPDKSYDIKVEDGKDMRCDNYCPVNSFCSYYKNKAKGEMANEGELF